MASHILHWTSQTYRKAADIGLLLATTFTGNQTTPQHQDAADAALENVSAVFDELYKLKYSIQHITWKPPYGAEACQYWHLYDPSQEEHRHKLRETFFAVVVQPVLIDQLTMKDKHPEFEHIVTKWAPPLSEEHDPRCVWRLRSFEWIDRKLYFAQCDHREFIDLIGKVWDCFIVERRNKRGQVNETLDVSKDEVAGWVQGDVDDEHPDLYELVFVPSESLGEEASQAIGLRRRK